ncbi:MAG: hypothetical protein D6782_03560, partial [Alphaproteobacteria bacterium]
METAATHGTRIDAMTPAAAHSYIDVTSRAGMAWQRRSHHPAPAIGGAYDRFVAAMRLFLPACAFALLAVTVGWLVFNPQESSFVLSRERVDISSERLRMEKPRYFGVDRSNRPFVVEARSALQESGETEIVSLAGIEANMELADGTKVMARANRGVFFMSAKRLALVGDVDVDASNGYRLHTADAELDLGTHIATGNRPVVGSGPLGRF